MGKYCYKCEKDVELVKENDSNAQLCIHCGTIIIHSASKLPPGTILSGFQIVEEIGRGGMGIVYRAQQMNLERYVALKVLADDLALDEEFVESFFKEARAAASLNHPNIVQVFDAGGTPEGIYYFAMELIVGETLEDRIKREGSFAPKEALGIAVKIAEALDYAWETQKLTHGDIKPDNIILNRSGDTKLADLGLARFMHDDNNDAAIMATPLYAPPEIIKGETDKIGNQSDMYSFGATFYQMLTGVPPFADDTPEVVFKHHLEDKPPLISEFNHHFSTTLVQLVHQLLEKNPMERPYSWADICKILKKIKEPEIEGKVFHTHHVSGDDDHKKHVAAVEEDSSKIKPLLYGLLTVAVLLLFAIVGVIIAQTDNEEDNSVDNVEIAPSGNSDAAKEKLDVIKSQLKYLTFEDLREKLKVLVKKYGDDTPEEARVLLAKTEKQIEAAGNKVEQQKRAKIAFDTKLAAFLQKITAMDFSNEKVLIKTIQALSADTEKLLQESSEKSYLAINNKDRKILNDTYMLMSARIIKNNQMLERIALRKQAELKQKQIDEANKKRAEKKKDRKEELAVNSAIDNYYVILADYLKSKESSDLDSNLEKWISSYTLVPAVHSMKVAFLRKTAIPAHSKFVKLLIKHADALADKTLPLSICPVKYRKYKVKSVDEVGIKLILNEGKVSLGYTIRWSRMPSKIITALIRERLLLIADGKPELTADEANIVLAYAILKAAKYSEGISAISPNVSKRNKRMWNFLLNDMLIAQEESKLVAKYKELKEAYDNKEYFQASELFVPLKNRSARTAFQKRHSTEFKRIENTLTSINPAIQANVLIERCADNKMKKRTVKLFNMCMTAYARYNNVLGQNASILRTACDESLNALVKNSGIKDLKANRIPFYYWSMEKTGTAWAYYDVVTQSGKMDGKPAVLKSMRLAATLDNGDWKSARQVYDSREALGIPGLVEMKRTHNWASSFIFARGMMDLQYGNGDKRQEAMTALIKLAHTGRNPSMKPMNTALAMEYAFMIRQPTIAMDLGSQYLFKLGTLARMEARVALLSLLCIMDKDTSMPGDFGKGLRNYRKAFQKIPKMRHGDIQWCQQAFNLMGGNFNPAHIEQLKKAKCDFPDVSARIMLSALARMYCTQGTRLPPEQEKKLLQAISSRISSIFVAGESWRRMMLFDIALQSTPEGMRRASDRYLRDYRISATKSYPDLTILKAGAEFATNNFSAEDTETNLKHFLEASVVASSNDFKLLGVIPAEIPSELVGKFYVNNLPDKGYLCGVLGLMIHYKKTAIRASIVRVINENYNLLSWEERFLVKQLQTWR